MNHVFARTAPGRFMQKDISKGECFMLEIRELELQDVSRVIAFERELREEEPDTYFWQPDRKYEDALRGSFSDPRFNTAVSFLALYGGRVVARIDASLISSRSDAACCSAYLDWICVLKSQRHQGIARALLKALRAECGKRGANTLIALTAGNDEAQRFYRSVEGASMHDTGIWMDL